MKPAVFLDRDGTIVRDVHHLADAARLELLPGAAEAIARLSDAGLACVVVSNQSAIGRGLLTHEGLAVIHEAFCRMLAGRGASIDGWYYCPAAPSTADRLTIDHPDRKPAPGMLLRAARELGLDVGASYMVGDMVSDVLAGRNAGCRASLLVRTGQGGDDPDARRAATAVCDDLAEAARWILADVAVAQGHTLVPGHGAGPGRQERA